MSYKLVVTDMDGTFLNNSSQISEKNMAAVRRLRELGIHFSPVTGRGTPGLMQFQPVLEQKELCITYNGCMVVDPVSQKILYHLTITEADARKVVAIAEQAGANMFIWSGNKPYALKDNETLPIYQKNAGTAITIVEDPEPLIQQGITKIMMYDGSLEHAQAWKAALDAHKEEFESLCVVMSGDGFLDVINSNANKGMAVAKLAESYGIKPEEVIAFGDAFNDVPMLDYAGMGVAMANAPEGVKAHGNYITLSNEADGVADALERFIFSEFNSKH